MTPQAPPGTDPFEGLNLAQDPLGSGLPWLGISRLIEQGEITPGAQARAKQALVERPLWPRQGVFNAFRMTVEMRRPGWLVWWFDQIERTGFCADPPWWGAVFGQTVARVRTGEPDAVAWSMLDLVLERYGNPGDRHGHHLAFEDALLRRHLALAERLLPQALPVNADILARALLYCARDAQGLERLRAPLMARAEPVAGDVLVHLRTLERPQTLDDEAWWSRVQERLQHVERCHLNDAMGSHGHPSGPNRARL